MKQQVRKPRIIVVHPDDVATVKKLVELELDALWAELAKLGVVRPEQQELL